MTQNPYGQAPQPGQPYGQAPQGGQPYGQGPADPYGYPPQYGQAAPYGQAQAVASYAPAKKSPALGIIGLLTVVVCGIVLSVFLWKVGAIAGPFVVDGAIPADQQSAMGTEIVLQLGSVWPGLGGLSSFLGLVGWILGIVATATKRGRAFGIIAIVLGALAPFIAFGAFTAALVPYVK